MNNFRITKAFSLNHNIVHSFLIRIKVVRTSTFRIAEIKEQFEDKARLYLHHDLEYLDVQIIILLLDQLLHFIITATNKKL